MNIQCQATFANSFSVSISLETGGIRVVTLTSMAVFYSRPLQLQ